MRLTTLMEMLDEGQDAYTGDEFAQPAPADEPVEEPADPPSDDQPITGYEISDDDWAALAVIEDGRGNTLPVETVQWLTTCGLVEGNPPALSELAIEWRSWNK